jgi:hypothetical protein
MTHTSDDQRLSETQIRDILQRAVQIEASGRSVTVGQLRAAAREAGIDENALSIAIDEALLATQTHSRAPTSLLSFITPRSYAPRPFMLAIAAAALGGLTGIAEIVVNDESLVDVPSVMLLVAGSLISALHRRRNNVTRGYGLEMIGMWIGYMTGWAIINLDVTNDLVFGVAGVIGTATYLAGKLIAEPWRFLAALPPFRKAAAR